MIANHFNSRANKLSKRWMTIGNLKMKIVTIKKWKLIETVGFDLGLFKCNFCKSGGGGEVKLFLYLFGCQKAEI